MKLRVTKNKVTKTNSYETKNLFSNNQLFYLNSTDNPFDFLT